MSAQPATILATVKSILAAAPVLPAASVAVTVSTCAPFCRATGTVQAVFVFVATIVPISVPLSYRLYVLPGTAVKANAGVLSCKVAP